MSFQGEHPDHAVEREMADLDEQHVRERAAERSERHAPHGRAVSFQPTTAMSVLAYSVLNASERDARDAARALAQLVLDAGEKP